MQKQKGMKTINEKLTKLKKTLKRAENLILELHEENKMLKNIVAEKEVVIKNKENQLENVEQELKFTKLAKNLGSAEDQKEMINQLIKEIDDCLQILD